MSKSIEVHDLSECLGPDVRDSTESAEGRPLFEAGGYGNDNNFRNIQNSRDRIRSLGGKAAENDRLGVFSQKKTSLPIEGGAVNKLNSTNSESLPTLSPNRHTTLPVTGNHTQILSCLKNTALGPTPGILRPDGKPDVIPAPLKQHTIPVFAPSNAPNNTSPMTLSW